MEEQEIIKATAKYVREELKNAEGGHDWFHVERVWKNSKLIGAKEPVNMFIVELGALLHDVADSKFHNGDETIGPRKAKSFLSDLNVTNEIIEHVVKIIQNISYKGGNIVQQFKSPELDVVQDADRLDAIGAIGVARTFNYGGFKQRPMYDPAIPPKLNMTKEEYKKSNNPTINHFYEKLLRLKDIMNTDTGRQLAKDRHNFLAQFLERFLEEWEGRK